jgi:hypothetical protein
MSRTRLGPRKPPADITAFPSLVLRKGKVLYRAHHVDNGPWPFAFTPIRLFERRRVALCRTSPLNHGMSKGGSAS